MKSFLLFAGAEYYAAGGMYDLHSQHDSMGAAIAEGEAAMTAPEAYEQLDWWHVFDTETMKVVAKSKYQAYVGVDQQTELSQEVFSDVDNEAE